MRVTIKPTGGDAVEVQVDASAAEGDRYPGRIAQRVVDRHDGGGSGKVTVQGWTYRYTFGTVHRPGSC